MNLPRVKKPGESLKGGEIKKTRKKIRDPGVGQEEGKTSLRGIERRPGRLGASSTTQGGGGTQGMGKEATFLF